MDKITVPFTKEQVRALQRYQKCGFMHPFTCCSDNRCNRHEREDQGVLIPTENGWVCPCGNYKQNWTHAFMTAEQENPFGDFLLSEDIQ